MRIGETQSALLHQVVSIFKCKGRLQMAWLTVSTALLFSIAFGCSSSPTRPHPASALAPASDLNPTVVNESSEVILLRFCVEHVWPLVREAIDIAEQIELDIERLERSDLGVSPGFMREIYGSCLDDVVMLVDRSSNCTLWAESQNAEEVFGLFGRAEGVKGVCEISLKSARNR